MKVDMLIAEIGSTTTMVTAFDNINTPDPIVVSQGEHYTTVKEGDVTIGIFNAIKNLEEKLGEKITWKEFLASSSAAGGLKMTVHGLVYDMTVKASKEAVLGAGAVLKYATAGKLRESNIEKIYEINPNLILLAGGVDYGEEETIIHNSKVIANSKLNVPIVYAGNCSVKSECIEILKKFGKKVIDVENVYPRVDELNVVPARKIIQEVFSKHIVYAPGMEKIYTVVDYEVIPTPGAVMLASELLAEEYKDILTVDIGGATTDVDSVTKGSLEIQNILTSPEPDSKRTVEGDLGLYVNAKNVIDMIGIENIEKKFPDCNELIKNISPYPKSKRQEEFIAYLGSFCFYNSIKRHAGTKKYLYTAQGRKQIATGKDLTAVKYIFGTGGILSRSNYRNNVFESLKDLNIEEGLYPNKKVKFAYDKNYIFAPIGVLATVNKKAAMNLLKKDITFI